MTTGVWSDFATGDAGGDPISLVAFLYGKSQGDAARDLEEQLGTITEVPKKRTSDPESLERLKLETCVKLWDAARSDDPLLTAYLTGQRGIPTPSSGWPSGVLRLHRSVPYGFFKGDKYPAILMRKTAPDGTLCGLHAIFLTEDGHKSTLDPAKKSYGRGGVIWIRRKTGILLATEGPEDAITLALSAGYAVVCTAGAGTLSRVSEAPTTGATEIVLVADRDASRVGVFAARKAADAITAIPVAIALPPEGCKDSNELLRQHGTGAISAMIDGRMHPKDGNIYKDQAEENGRKQPKNRNDHAERPSASPVASSGPDIDNSALGQTVKSAIENNLFKPLGYNRGTYYYFSFSQHQIIALKTAAHTKTALLSLAGLGWWEIQFPGSTGCSWEQAIRGCFAMCDQAGLWDPDERVRGRGAWLDDGRPVLHLGSQLLVDGHAMAFRDVETRYVYEAGKPLGITTAEPLPVRRANHLLEVTTGFRWKRPLSARLLAGWCVIAPICGALHWRPHIWVTSPAGSGKSTLMECVIQPILAGVSLRVMSGTTAAGIRHALGQDALPVIFDEAEQEDLASKVNMKQVFVLARAASSESGFDILKGDKNQENSKRYTARSCFCWSSINVGITDYADQTRSTILELCKIDGSTEELKKQNAEHWKNLKKTIADVINPAFSAGLLARSVSLIPVIRQNAEIFSDVGSIVFGSRRIGDQIGAMLAGAYSLHADDVVAPEFAKKWLDNQDWSDHTVLDAEPDERRFISTLLQEVVKVDMNGHAREATIGECIQSARNEISSPFEDVIRRMGIRPTRTGVLISTTHKALRHILRDTPWSAGWRRQLLALPGATKAPGKGTVNFGAGLSTYAVFIPYESVLEAPTSAE